MVKDNIALLTTVANFELYNKSISWFPEHIQKFVIDGRNGMYGIHSIKYMMRKLKGRGIEWLIMADEDVLFINPQGIDTIIAKMKEEDYVVAGVRDGGQIDLRIFNPYVINTFFSVINFKVLEAIWDESALSTNQYVNDNEFDDALTGLSGIYDVRSLYEPYYCLYLWIRRLNYRILFLEASTPLMTDPITTLVMDTEGEPLLYHTWYARSYGTNIMHTERIDNVLKLLQLRKHEITRPIIFKHKTFYWQQKISRMLFRIKRKYQSITL